MSDLRQFAKIDLGYFDNPKITEFVDEHPRVPILHLRAILYCRQHLTDGEFPVRTVARMACATYCGEQCSEHSGEQCGEQCDVCKAVLAGLFEMVDARTARVHDYLEHQDSADQAAARKARSQKAAAARWNAPSNADSNAPSNADGNAYSNAPSNAEKRRGEKRRDRAHSAPTRGTRLPDGWLPDDAVRQAMAAEFPGLDFRAEHAKFSDHWKSQPGQKGVKVDWDATWRNWIRKSAEYAPRHLHPVTEPPRDDRAVIAGPPEDDLRREGIIP